MTSSSVMLDQNDHTQARFNGMPFVLALLALLMMGACSAPSDTASLPPQPYFGGPASPEPSLMFPNVLSTPSKELNGTFTIDGQHFFYSIDNPAGDHATLVHTSLGADGWTAPDIAAFSGLYSDVDPLWTPSGDRLFFCSNRPLSGIGPPKDYDIWYVERIGTTWSDPINPGPPLNSPRNDFYPSSTLDGRIYFTRFDVERNTDDVHVAIPTPEGYRVENIGDSINTPQGEYDPFVSPYEDYILFTSYRAGDMGGGDLYISFRRMDHWSPAIHLGPTINGSGREYCPFITFDQQYFIFTSTSKDQELQQHNHIHELKESHNQVLNGNGNIYWCKADWILALDHS
ncbi:MAG: hypothetical protein KTR24_02375 [Saprospiraceae bacterium]|nr:hypothetical protein [Saprospiraceae bacterium]